MPWWQLGGLIEHLPRESAVVRSLLGEAAEWSIDTHIAAHAADAAWVSVWQNSAGKKSDYPKPIPRPGEQEAQGDDKTYASKPRTFAEIDALFARVREGGDDVSQSRSQRLT